jgi:hypothetical protein
MEDHPIFDAKKVDKLLSTIMDFIQGTKLTNAEIDFVINRLWMETQAGRVAAMAVDRIPRMMMIPFEYQEESEPTQPTGRPGYIH